MKQSEMIKNANGNYNLKGKEYRFFSAKCKGYISRKSTPDDRYLLPYSGLHGVGYTVELPSFDSTWYCFKGYFIEV